QNLTYKEVLDWQSYRLKHGPLCNQRRITDATESLMFLIATINKTNLKPEDLKLYRLEEDQESPPEESVSVHDIFAAIKGVAKQNKPK
ncbi:hypothetical protein, partial [Vibrio anguillarum]